MAIEHGWTGFENGEADACVEEPIRGSIIGDATARTGEFYAGLVSGIASVNSFARYRRINTAMGSGMGLGGTATTLMRVFFRLDVNVSVSNCGVCGVGGVSETAQTRAHLIIDTTRHFAAAVVTTLGTYSTATLSLGVWYIAEITYVITQNAGASCTVAVSIDVRNEDGTLIETVTRSLTIATVAVLPTGVTIGNATLVTSTYSMGFDDWWWGSADGTDQASLALPTATRITRVPPTAQGAAADWTGDYRTVVDAPRQTATTDEQSSAATIGLTTTFAHASAATLLLGTIAGVIVRGELRAPTGSAGNEALMLDGVEYTVAVPLGGAYNHISQSGVSFTAWTAGQFDAAEFGARNKRGVGTGLRLATSYLEVLHDGASLPAPFINGTGPWCVEVTPFVGNGTYQTISGVGFGSQAVIIKPRSSGGVASGVLKLARQGGTWANSYAQARVSNAVLTITADGVELGPSLHVNESGVDYLAVCFKDGGSAGFHLSHGAQVGNELDSRNIVMPEPFLPDLVHVQGDGQTFGSVLRTSAMTGDQSRPLNTQDLTTNMIQSLLATGYQVGTDVKVNGVNEVYAWIALLIDVATTPFLHVGKITPSGTSFTVTGIPFAPAFVVARPISGSASGHWRGAAVHTGLNSTQWGGATQVANAITSLTADGFTGGSAISAAGVDVYWFACTSGCIQEGGCTVDLLALAGGVPPANGCLTSLLALVGSPAATGCRVSL